VFVHIHSFIQSILDDSCVRVAFVTHSVDVDRVIDVMRDTVDIASITP